MVFRLVTHIEHHFPPDADKPLPAAFSLTPEDKRDPSPRLSVWDKARTTVEQARMIRARAAGAADRTPGNTTPFGFHVRDIHSVRVMGEDAARLSVVHDPLLPADGPGFDGHCGIVGLDGISNEPGRKNIRKELRHQLVQRCFRLS